MLKWLTFAKVKDWIFGTRKTRRCTDEEVTILEELAALRQKHAMNEFDLHSFTRFTFDDLIRDLGLSAEDVEEINKDAKSVVVVYDLLVAANIGCAENRLTACFPRWMCDRQDCEHNFSPPVFCEMIRKYGWLLEGLRQGEAPVCSALYDKISQRLSHFGELRY